MNLEQKSCPFANQHKVFEHPGTYQLFNRAREECPVFYSEEIGYWVVTRYEDIAAILRNPKIFSADIALQPVSDFPEALTESLREKGFIPEKVHPDCDPPKHQRIRNIATQYINLRTFKSLEDKIRMIVREYIAEMKGQKVVDIVEALTYEVPARVLLLLFGETNVDAKQLKSWGNNRLALVWGHLDEEEQMAAGEELLAFWNFAGSIVKDRLANPRDDYPSFLINKRDGDDSILSLNEIQSMLYGLLFAGHETTTNAAGNLIIELMSNRDQWMKLVNDRSLVPNAVEEGLRFASSVVAWRRRTNEPVEICGVSIPENAKLLICLGSGNRDDAKFDNAETFDIERKDSRKYLTFGQGEHFCIGGPLARIELNVMLEELVAAFPNMRLVENQDFNWAESISFRGPQQLLVELGG